ncbi:MAG: phage tail assembly protein T [Aestuariivirga sp.]
MREWQAYAQVEPFGPPAAFWQAGLLAATLVNVNRTKKSQKAMQPADFMPESFQLEAESPDAAALGEQVAATFKRLAAAQHAGSGGRE